jgi:branched-subunit amino acid ABC-type transport system permease component
MGALNISVSLLIALFAIFLLLYRTHRLKAHRAAFGSQRMCPACGLITSRLKTCCLACGKLLPARAN